MRRFLNALPAALFLSLVCASMPLHAVKLREAQAVASTKGAWTSSQQENVRHFDYSAKVVLLGKTVPITLAFYCDTTDSKDVRGTLGFDLYLSEIAQLKPFDFEAFEGPDAVSAEKKLLRATLYREGKVLQALDFSPSGFTPSSGFFGFTVAELTATAKSEPKSLLRALEAGADILMISITDYRNPKLKLEFPVSVTGKGPEFKTLLSGVK